MRGIRCIYERKTGQTRVAHLIGDLQREGLPARIAKTRTSCILRQAFSRQTN